MPDRECRFPGSPRLRGGPARRRLAACWRRAGGLVALALTAVACWGCGLRDRPDYNPYAPPGGDPPLLQRAEAAVDIVDDAANELDAWMENAVY